MTQQRIARRPEAEPVRATFPLLKPPIRDDFSGPPSPIRPSIGHTPGLCLQAKMAVNTPGDSYEQEADQVAEQVVHMSVPEKKTPITASSSPQIQRCACQHKEPGEQQDEAKPEISDLSEGGLQRAPGFASETSHKRSTGAGEDVSPLVNETLGAGGQALDPETRGFMEPRFGHDFSRVRIHTDAKAVESAEAVNALAYTVGEDIVFRSGQFSPGTSSGRQLLAHELTHVVQQGAGRPTDDRKSVKPKNHTNAPAIQRVTWEPDRATDPSAPGHTAGDDYQGPNGTVTHPAAPAVGVGAIGGLVSYGCYCGPGGDASGSRCGPGAAAVDGIDEQCRQHDANYGSRHIDSGSTPGTHNMFTSKEGWLDAEDADQRLHDTTQREMQLHGGSYSPTARLFGQGIQGVFGGRAGLSHAYKWGAGKVGEAEAGLSQAYDWGADRAGQAAAGIGGAASQAYNWGSGMAGQAAAGIGGAAGQILNWGGGMANQAAAGIGGAANQAYNWGSGAVGQAASGIGGAASSAAGWLGGAAGQAAAGVGGAASQALDWGSGVGSQAAGGIGSFLSGASHWGSISDAVSGIGNGLGDAARWGSGVAGQATSGIGGAVSGAAGWLGGAAGQAASGIGGAASSAMDWLGSEAGQAASGIGGAAGQAAGWLGGAAGQAAAGVGGAASSAAGWLGGAAGQAASGIGGAAGQAAGWLGETAGQAATGAGQAAGWIGNTASEAYSGLSGAASGVAGWARDTGGVLADVASSWF